MFYIINEQKLKVHVCDIYWLLGLREILEIIMANGLGLTLSLCVCVCVCIHVCMHLGPVQMIHPKEYLFVALNIKMKGNLICF